MSDKLFYTQLTYHLHLFHTVAFKLVMGITYLENIRLNRLTNDTIRPVNKPTSNHIRVASPSASSLIQLKDLSY